MATIHGSWAPTFPARKLKWAKVSWDAVVPPTAAGDASFEHVWRLRLLGSVLAVMSVLLLGMAIKDWVAYGFGSTAFHLSMAQVAVFLGCFLVFRFAGLEGAAFLTAFTAGQGLLLYSIYRSGDPHPAMIVWLPIVPFLLAVYRSARFVAATTAVTLLFLIAYGLHLHASAPTAPSAGAVGEVAIGLLTAATLALLFRLIQQHAQRDMEAQARVIHAQGEAMRADLAHASVFQQGLMPKIRETRFLDIATVFQPQGQVSGDVYAIYYNREGALNIFLGDASGHGVSSAFLTMMVHIGLHQLRADLPPATTLERLNANLNAHNLSDMFVTGVYLRIEPDGRATVAHAGHPSILVLRAKTREVVRFQESGVPMGLFGEGIAVYQNETLHLEPGDTVLLHTDGITERTDPRDQLYGIERLGASLRTHASQDLERTLHRIVQDSEAFAQGRVRTDDLSLIALRYKSPVSAG